MMYETTLSISGLSFRLKLPAQPQVDREIAPFVVETDEVCDITVDYVPDETVAGTELTVSPTADSITVRFQPELSFHFAALRGCLIHVPMERILLAHDRFFLHASFVASPFGGLLFTGNSGAGKSTQAELWRKYMDSTVINGDRTIVAKEADGWRAYGSPYAGSSGYYVKQDEPIRAIVLLEQGQENQISRAGAAEAFRRLFLQISADYGQTEEVEKVCDLVTELLGAVAVYQLRCTPDVRAVNVLREALEKEGRDG